MCFIMSNIFNTYICIPHLIVLWYCKTKVISPLNKINCISINTEKLKTLLSWTDHAFYTPVFRRDVLWYGDVRPSVRPGLVRPSVRRPSQFPHFSPTCFEILSWNFMYHFILMHVRSSSNVINFRQFLLELCPFWTSNSYKYAVFRTFLLHALTYWPEILHMTLCYCTTDQVRLSSISVNFAGVMPLLELRILEIVTQFSALFSYIRQHIELKFYIWLCFTKLQNKFECRQFASIFVEVMPLLGLRILEIHSFPHFSPTCFDMLSWNFSYDFV